jgi:DHA1 family tetracycline resistance protein-like MFS transporter
VSVVRPDAPPGAFSRILAIIFLDAMGLMLLSPVIPFIVEPFRADAMAVAELAFAYSAAQFLTTPLLGALSDRWGRRPVLVLSFAGSAVTYAAFGWAPALWVLFAGRLIDGLTGANIGTSQAYIADITAPADRSRAMGLAYAVLGLGFAAGPLAGYFMARAGITPNGQALSAIMLAVASLLLTVWGLPDARPATARAHKRLRWTDLNPLAPLRGAVLRTNLRRLLGAHFLANLAIAALRAVFAIFALVRLDFGPREVNSVMGFLGLMMVVAQGGLVRKAVVRWGDRGTLLTGLVVSTAGFAAIAATTEGWHVYTAVALTAIGLGLALPTLAALVSRRATADEQGAMLGAAQAAAALGQVAGPLLAGQLFDAYGPGSPFGVGAIFVLGALVLVWRDGRRA